MKKVLAIDFGLKRVGFASADTENKVAVLAEATRNLSFEQLSELILNKIADYGYKILIFGLPLNMKEEHGENLIMKKLREFIDLLEKRLPKDVRIEFFDERLSTFEAKEIMAEQGDYFKDKLEFKDSLSAQIILQRWLDSL